MTGFASGRGRVGERQFLLEAKSVNHRFCEVNVRLPGKYAAWELPIQKCVRGYFERGRFDIFLKEEGTMGSGSREHAQFKKAHRELKRLARELKLSDKVSLENLMFFKQHYYREDESFDANTEWKRFRPLLEKMLQRLLRMRQQEGEQLGKWFRQHHSKLTQFLKRLSRRVQRQAKLHRKKVTARMKDLGFGQAEGDPRLAAEIAVMTDKLDVTEEQVRLETHLGAFGKILREGGPVGRKIDFLMQEVSREINTIAAKSQDSDIATMAVQLKTEIEKIREQAGNVE